MNDSPSSAEPSKGRVLLAEDHPLNQRVATVMLEQLGFCVDVVADGAEAVKAANVTRYHAIFMDCQIPLLDGYQATAAIRLHHGASRCTPIIAVTASGGESDRQRCLNAGMDDYLTKPLSLKKLAAVRAGRTAHGAVARVLDATDGFAPARVEGSQRPVLDAEVVARLERLGRSADQDLFGQLAVLFLADADAWLDALWGAFNRGDAHGIMNAAHTLGGAGANLGATELAALCEQLSSADGLAPTSALVDVLDAVEAELTRVRAVLSTPVLTP